MSKLFSKLGRSAAPAFIKGKWVWRSITGSEIDRIDSEHEMGAFLAHEYLATTRLANDPEMAVRVKNLGARLCECLTNTDRHWAFNCVDVEEPNAFALPGGFIFLSRALVDLCNSDDELASVIAHEIGHVVKGHAFDRMLAANMGRLLTGGSLATGALRPLLKGLVTDLVAKGYSRTQEFEADTFAVRLMRAAGLDGHGMVTLFERLDSLSQDDSLPFAEYFASHPSLPERVESANRLCQ